MIRDVRRVLAKDGLNALRVDDLTNADLPLLGWSGSRGHVVSVGRALERVDSGEVEYLVARAPNGQPIAKAGIDYASSPGAGTLWQLATAYELQGLGIGPHLVAAAEGRIRERGLTAAELGVEDNNPRARALYERLGYRERASWNVDDPEGNVTLCETELAVLRKELNVIQ